MDYLSGLELESKDSSLGSLVKGKQVERQAAVLSPQACPLQVGELQEDFRPSQQEGQEV